MNDKDWADNPDFWDDEEHGEDDDDEYNGLGTDVDANNDETFDNAAEWNEDEHEELIARDLILSHKPSPPKQPAVQQPPVQQPPVHQPQTHHPQILTVDELERQLLRTSINQNVPPQPRIPRAQPETSRRAGWSPFGGKDLFTRGDDPSSADSVSLLDTDLFQNMEHRTLTLEQQQNIILQQQQRLILQQQQLLQQHQQQQQLQQHHRQQQHQHQHKLQQSRHQERNLNQQPQHFALFAHHQPPLATKVMPTNVRCFTVEELERQMLANRTNNVTQQEQDNKKINNLPDTSDKTRRLSEQTRQLDEPRNRNIHDKRNGERQDRHDRYNRDMNETRDHYKDRRDVKHHRENHRLHRREPIIIPPQVQLSVISKAKRRHSITAMHEDEFIRDRMPVSGEGFRFLRHSQVAGNKVKHDGVLTDKERDWLTRIQEKIQADYDNNLDQDYYYLLYFNRSSMSDEAAQKPMGHGVLDRRFIPRERLLYNSGV